MFVIITEKDYIIRYVCSFFLKRTGYQKEEVLGKNVLDFFYDRDIILKLKRKGIDQDYKTKLFAKDNRPFWISMKIDPIPWGENQGLICSMDEIFPKREEEGLIQQVIDILPDPILAIDTNGVVLLWNKAMEQVTGIKKEEVLGKGDYIYALPFYGERRPTLIDLVFNPDSNFERKYENFQRNEDGSIEGESYIPLIDYYDWAKASPIYDERGEKIGAVKISRSIGDIKKAEKDLIISRNRFKALFHNSPDAIAYLDNHHRIIDINPAFSQLFGYTLEECKGKDLDDVVTQGNQLEKAKNITKELFNRSFVNAEGVRYKKTGEPIYVSIRGILVKIDDVIVGGYGIYTDITESKRYKEELEDSNEELEATLEQLMAAEEELRHQYEQLVESEEKYRTLVTQMQQGLALHEVILNEEGEVIDYRFIDVNESFEKLTGFKKEELIGKRVIEILPGTDEYWIEKYGEVAKTGNVLYYEYYSKKLGKYYEVITYRPKPLQFATIVSDITDRKMLEKALEKEKELFRTTLMSVGDGVIAVDSTGNIMIFNEKAEEITGLKANEVLGKSFETVFSGLGEMARTKCRNLFENILKSHFMRESNIDIIYIIKDDTEKWISYSAAPIKDKEDNVQGMVVALRDITKEREKQVQIEYLSYHDQLTGLYNRRFLEEEIRRLDTPRQLPISFIMGDVNGLKLTNDVFGHEAGDLLLMEAATLLKECCRDEDLIARWGGDEFVILLTKTDMKIASEIVEKIRNKCFLENEAPIQVSIALGHATKNKEEEDIWEVLKETEEAMYRNKILSGRSYRNAVLSTLKATLFEKSMETEEHAERLKNICFQIGKELGLSGRQMDDLALLAVLHDIGKVAINEDILKKPGPLTEEEWVEMKKHPEIGYRIAQSSQELASISEYILCHHERWDGEGYPQGLRGNEIPLLSRILSVADAYDAMTSDRVYRKAMSREEAVAEIIRETGTRFDPEIVKVFIEKCCYIDHLSLKVSSWDGFQ